MDVFVNFKDLFLSVWEKGILGINFYEILIGIGIFRVIREASHCDWHSTCTS